MPYRANYPATVAEILSDRQKFKPAALAAVRRLRRDRAWRGTRAERFAKLQTCCRELAAAYGIACPVLVDGGGAGHSGSSNYQPFAHRITLIGRLSVVTFLHEFAHARGYDERQAVRWSVNLFRRVFPRSFAACRQVGHTLVR